jgi:hypothetical protein
MLRACPRGAERRILLWGSRRAKRERERSEPYGSFCATRRFSSCASQQSLSLAGSCAGRVYELGKRTEKPNNDGEEQSPKRIMHRAKPNDGGELAYAQWAKRIGQCVLGVGQCVLGNNGGETRL